MAEIDEAEKEWPHSSSVIALTLRVETPWTEPPQGERPDMRASGRDRRYQARHRKGLCSLGLDRRTGNFGIAARPSAQQIPKSSASYFTKDGDERAPPEHTMPFAAILCNRGAFQRSYIAGQESASLDLRGRQPHWRNRRKRETGRIWQATRSSEGAGPDYNGGKYCRCCAFLNGRQYRRVQIAILVSGHQDTVVCLRYESGWNPGERRMQPAKFILFLLGGFALILAIGVEFGSPWLLHFSLDKTGERPGIGITSVACLDLVFAYTIALISVDFLPGIRTVFARIQGIVTFILSLIGLGSAFLLIVVTYNFIMLMVSLLLAVPFGTIAYFAVWGVFDVDGAKIVLSLAMLLKLVGVGFIVASNMSFIKNKGFLFLTICSLGLSFVLGLLHSVPPGFLVSITDAIGALVTAIVILVWALLFFVGSIFAILRAIRSVVPV